MKTAYILLGEHFCFLRLTTCFGMCLGQITFLKKLTVQIHSAIDLWEQERIKHYKKKKDIFLIILLRSNYGIILIPKHTLYGFIV